MRVAAKLIPVLGVVLLFGAGCFSKETNVPPPAAPVASKNIEIPKKANPQVLFNTNQKIKSVDIINQLKVALDNDTDVQLLISKYKQLGFEWDPTSTDFLALTDSDGSPLVGLYYRRYLVDPKRPTYANRSAYLFALFPWDASPFTHPRYLALGAYDSSAVSFATVYWVDAGQLQSVSGPPPGQEMFHAK